MVPGHISMGRQLQLLRLSTYSNPRAPTMFVGGSRFLPFRYVTGGAGLYGSRMAYNPGDAMGVLIYAACVMLGPSPNRRFSVSQTDKGFFLMTHQI